MADDKDKKDEKPKRGYSRSEGAEGVWEAIAPQLEEMVLEDPGLSAFVRRHGPLLTLGSGGFMIAMQKYGVEDSLLKLLATQGFGFVRGIHTRVKKEKAGEEDRRLDEMIRNAVVEVAVQMDLNHRIAAGENVWVRSPVTREALLMHEDACEIVAQATRVNRNAMIQIAIKDALKDPKKARRFCEKCPGYIKRVDDEVVFVGKATYHLSTCPKANVWRLSDVPMDRRVNVVRRKLVLAACCGGPEDKPEHDAIMRRFVSGFRRTSRTL
ncbi:MAG: hypothetical protein AAB733_01375 [Patescibacteria group bacterium]